jgi:Flp pilus assembly pilin Flp
MTPQNQIKIDTVFSQSSFHSKPSSYFQFTRFCDGQTLSEYALALCLVGVVAIVGLVNLSGSVNGLFDSMISSKSSGQEDNITADVGGGLGNPLPGTGGTLNLGTGSSSSGLLASFNYKTPFSNLPGSQMEIDLGSKGKFNFNIADFKATAEAAGGSGATLNAVALIQQLLDQLEKNPELADPESIDALKELSRRGYLLASMQDKVQNLLGGQVFTTSKEKAEFVSTAKIDLGDGLGEQKLSDVALYFDAGFYLPSGAQGLPSYPGGYRMQEFDQGKFTDPGTAPASTQYFMQQMETVRSSKFMLENPVLRDLVINAASKQIFLSSLSTPYVMSGAEVGELSEITDTRAKVICTASKNNDCQPR